LDKKSKRTKQFYKELYYDPVHKEFIARYLGDHTVGKEAPHGNATKSKSIFLPTVGQVKEDILAYQPTTTNTEIFIDMTSHSHGGRLDLITQPRNKASVSKYRLKMLDQLEVTRDVRENIDVTAANLGPDFVRMLDMSANIPTKMVLATDAAIKEYRRMIANMPADEPAVLLMDTTYDAGPFYFTLISTIHGTVTRPRYIDEPGVTMTMAINIHVKRPIEHHEQMMQRVEQIYELPKHPTVLVTDREFKNLRVWDNCKKALCWNHLKDNLERRHKDLGVRKGTIQNKFGENFMHSLHPVLKTLMKEERKGTSKEKVSTLSGPLKNSKTITKHPWMKMSRNLQEGGTLNRSASKMLTMASPPTELNL